MKDIPACLCNFAQTFSFVLKIGVLGAGHLGKIHLKLIREISDYELAGFYDPDDAKASAAEKEFGIIRFHDTDALIAACDVVDVVTPTLSHYDCAAKAMQLGKHVFIEKPLAGTLEEAKKLIEIAEQTGVKAMVGHVERFNPAFLALSGMTLRPMFIETHRLAQFNPRGTDVSVVLDLMIHDIDIILNIVHAPVSRISASGVAVISKTPDIANARIEFENGCVANITCSRISMKQMRKIRLFQQDAYISMDLLEKNTEIIRMTQPDAAAGNVFTIDTGNGEQKSFTYDKKGDPGINAIKMELELFARSIMENTLPRVTLTDGYNAMKIAQNVLEAIEKNKPVGAI